MSRFVVWRPKPEYQDKTLALTEHPQETHDVVEMLTADNIEEVKAARVLAQGDVIVENPRVRWIVSSFGNLVRQDIEVDVPESERKPVVYPDKPPHGVT